MIEARKLIKEIENLRREGIKREPTTYSFITQYPPPLTLNKINNLRFRRKSVELYIHIPFCTGKCAYCKFFSFCTDNKKVIKNYLNNIKGELEIYLKKSDLKDRIISSIYVGGGTPSILGILQIRDLLKFIRKNLKIDANAEITIESSPETLTKEKLKSYQKSGINRISIGIQDFNDYILQFTRRRHNGAEAIEAVKKARKAGFKKMNIDLIYGLPKQTINHWKNNLGIISKLRPEYITIYHLRREKGTIIAAIKKSEFPPKEEIIKMYLESLNRLTELGYIQIAPDQFALPGNSFKQQENKWKSGKELVGLGASAYSFFNGFVYYNTRSIKDYGKLAQEGKLPVWIGKEVSKKELMRRTLIFGLKTSGINREDSGLDKKMFEERFGVTVESFFGVELERLRKLGLIKDNGDFIKLSLTGLVLSEEVCKELYSPEIKTQLDKIKDKFGRGGL